MEIKYKDFTIEFTEKINFKLLSYQWRPGPTFMTMKSEDGEYLYITYSWEDHRRNLFNYEEEAFSIGIIDTPEKREEAIDILAPVYKKLYEEYLKDPNQEFDMINCLREILGDEPFEREKVKIKV